MEITIDKDALESEARALLGEAFAEFERNPDAPNSCSVGAFESLDDSGWAGKWTERIREIARSLAPAAKCVCVKPLQFGEVVWYRVDVA